MRDVFIAPCFWCDAINIGGSLIIAVLGASLDYCIASRHSASVNPGTRDVYYCEHRR